jgi:intraflagellar transport protein 56
VLFNIAAKQGNEEKLLQLHPQLTDSIEDQLSLAAVHFHRR